VVLRDAPTNPETTLACVERAMARRVRAALACAVPRSVAVATDPAAVAAARRPSPRVHLVDLTAFMCDRRRCFPVIGGVLVHRDRGHLTKVFSTTLGPFMLRALNEVTGSAARRS
jgi:hypothetical protein